MSAVVAGHYCVVLNPIVTHAAVVLVLKAPVDHVAAVLIRISLIRSLSVARTLRLLLL